MKRFFKLIEIGQKEKRVQRADFKAVVENATGTITLTDLMLQDGAQATGHLPATREMLRKLREDDLPAAPKYFNAIIRGRQTLVIPNRGAYWRVPIGTPVVTTAIDFTVAAKTVIPVGMQFSHFHRTRQFTFGNTLSAGDVFEFLASQLRVAHNGVPTRNYTGIFHQCAVGNSRFNIDLMTEGATIRPQPTARVLIEIQEWELASGGRRL
ncbi:MAG: hypothetical protein Q8N36_05265 [bacterium]|nr:hypothetical protein [bacterium]